MIMGHANCESCDQQKNDHQSAILDRIHLKLCTLIHFMIVYKFPIHYVYKLWSWVMQIVKVVIFGKIQQKNDRQSAILDRIHLKFCTLMQSVIVYMFPIDYVSEWRRVKEIFRFFFVFSIFSQLDFMTYYKFAIHYIM